MAKRKEKKQTATEKTVQDNLLRKLSRAELLEMLIEQTKRADELERRLGEAAAELEKRQLIMRNAGSMAQAAMELNGIFEAADRAVQQFVESVKGMPGVVIPDMSAITKSGKTPEKEVPEQSVKTEDEHPFANLADLSDWFTTTFPVTETADNSADDDFAAIVRDNLGKNPLQQTTKPTPAAAKSSQSVKAKPAAAKPQQKQAVYYTAGASKTSDKLVAHTIIDGMQLGQLLREATKEPAKSSIPFKSSLTPEKIRESRQNEQTGNLDLSKILK